MSTITVTYAGIDELPILMHWRMLVMSDIFAEKLTAMKPAQLEALYRENRDYYVREIPLGQHIACFARDAHGIVGCGGLCLSGELPSPENPSGRVAYLTNIYTMPYRRGQGIAHCVVRWLIAKAVECGCGKIILDVMNEKSSLYTDCGFERMGDTMRYNFNR